MKSLFFTSMIFFALSVFAETNLPKIKLKAGEFFQVTAPDGLVIKTTKLEVAHKYNIWPQPSQYEFAKARDQIDLISLAKEPIVHPAFDDNVKIENIEKAYKKALSSASADVLRLHIQNMNSELDKLRTEGLKCGAPAVAAPTTAR